MVTVELGFVLVFILGCTRAVPSTLREDETGWVEFTWGNTVDMVTEQGYPVETHQVTTEDGYILMMHRIPHGYYEVPPTVSKPVVFLMHGLTSASHAYVGIGRELSMGFNLADAGFDVWMGNARGNAFSRAHETLDPDHAVERLQFFDFTWDEIGSIDVPTMIDYALEVTGRTNLQYVGHSQGGTAFLVMASMRPEYSAKITSAHLLAGVGYVDYFPQPILSAMAQQTDFLFNMAVRVGFVELSPMRPITPLMNSQCHAEPDLENMCAILQKNPILNLTLNNNEEQTDIAGSYGIIGGTAGAAVKQFAHYGQAIQAKTFRRWNYGRAGNIAAYGTEDPPIYDISRITINTTMHYTISDELLDERDVLNMVADMPNCVARKIARDSFSHTDFVSAVDAKELVTDYIIEFMLEVENRFAPTSPGTVDAIDNSASSAAISLILQISLLVCTLNSWLI